MIDHDHFLDLFEKRKMKVDRTKRRVFFTEDIINELLDPSPGKGNDLEVAPSFPVKPGIGGSYPKYHDWATKKTVAGSTETSMELIKTFNAMEDYPLVGRILTLTDVPQPIEPIIATAMVMKHSPRPGRGEVYHASNIPYLIELGEILTGKPGCGDFVPNRTFIVPPLKITKDEADLIIEKAKYLDSALAGTMPSAGATSPVTREGTAVIMMAEAISTWLCYRVLAPDISLGAVCASSSLDMKKAECRFSSPEAIIQDCAAAQILKSYFGVPARTSSGYVDAKTPGIQTTYEKLFKTWWSYQFQGWTNFSPGLLEAGQTFCPAQALLDMDMLNSINALFAKEPSIESEVPFEDIHDVIHQEGTFLTTDHTLSMFREILHQPEFLNQDFIQANADKTTEMDALLDLAQARFEEVRENACEYRAPDHICKAVDEVVERATKAILNKAG